MRLGQFNFVIEKFPDITPIFELIRRTGDVSWNDMFTTFNMGIGLIVIVSKHEVDKAIEAISKYDRVYEMGVVEKSKKGQVTINSYGVKIE